MQPAAPPPDEPLLHALAEALRQAAAPGWSRLEAEWSQAGTQHSGRAFRTDDAGIARIPLPDGAVAAFSALRARTAAPATGAWFSAHVVLTPDGPPVLTPNHDRRPAWNSVTTSMLDLPDGVPPVPDEARWLADLRRHPRDRAHLPGWLAPAGVEGEAVVELRGALDGAGVPRPAVRLPGEPEGPVFDGVVEVVRVSGAHYTVRVTDYGQHVVLGEHRTERDACVHVWQYLTAPQPRPVALSRQEVEQRAGVAHASYGDLYARLRNVGPGGLITNLATGVPYDRYGGPDGLYLFGWGTPWEQRSLPPTAQAPGARLVTFVALRPIEVQAEIVPPWFDQPGGGVRFHVEGGRALRDLVREQVLALVDVVG